MINLKEGRAGFETIGNTYAVEPGILREDIMIANVPCAWFIPPGASQDNVVIYIHGGAFIFGSVNSHAPLVSYLALSLNRKILVIDYHLAPEHPFPSGVDDCVEVISAIHKQFPRISFGIIGDSAGGNIAMATQLRLKEIGGPASAYTIVISPWVDLECNNDSYTRNKTVDIILAQPYLMEAAKMYAGDHVLSDPYLSPVNADLHGLAPVFILCGTYEILEDDSVKLYDRLLACDVKAEISLFEGELHVWPFMDISSNASRKALKDISDFVKRVSNIISE